MVCLVGRGRSYKKAAEILDCSVHTVRSHLRRVRLKNPGLENGRLKSVASEVYYRFLRAS